MTRIAESLPNDQTVVQLVQNWCELIEAGGSQRDAEIAALDRELETLAEVALLTSAPTLADLRERAMLATHFDGAGALGVALDRCLRDAIMTMTAPGAGGVVGQAHTT